MVGYVARAVLLLTLLPLESAAQTPASTSAESFQASIAAITTAPPPLLSITPQPSAAAPAPLSRRTWIVIGTGIGFGGGLVFGEYYFGRHLDMPHGPDMLLGGMIGASAGALVAWLGT